MTKYSDESTRLWPYLLPFVEKAISRSTNGNGGGGGGGGGGGVGAPTPHALNSSHHTGTLSATQGAIFLLADGTRDLAGNLSVVGGVTIDGVDLDVHVADPNAHHDEATAGDGIIVTGQEIAVRPKSPNSGLVVDSSGVAVGAGDGIDVLLGTVAVDVTDFVDTTRGLYEPSTNDIGINLATNSGLQFGSGQLQLGTPTVVSAVSLNAVTTTTHTHDVTSTSDVGTSEPGVNTLLHSTPTGGLTLGSLTVTGSATVDESFTAADTAFRVINHTHDYPHSHVVINPTGSWSLDEQFGLDVDDNLLVRGWIVGKHAIQVKDAEMLVHFDGPPPVETNFKGNPTGHMGQVGFKAGGATFRPGRFGKAISVGEATTNLITNPSFEVNTTGWSTFGTVAAFARRGSPSSAGGYSAWISVSDDFSGIASNSMTFTSGQSYTFSFDVMHSDGLLSNNWFARFRKAGTGVSTFLAFTPPVDEWQRVSFTWLCNATGSDYDLSIYSNVSLYSRILIDAVQVEHKAYATPYCDGSLGGGETETGHSWSGTAHASSSSRSGSYVTYDDESLDDFGHPMTVMAWIKPSSNGSYQSITAMTDVGLTVGWEFANSSGTLRAITRGADVDVAGGTLPLDTWSFVAFTYNGSTLRLYLNGVETGTGGGTSTTLNTENLYVGARPGGALFNGLIDELALIRRVLTVDEVRAIYESNAPIFAETSTWHFRAGRNRIYADAEGLWGLGANYGEILGLYAGEDNNLGATKSWGGLSLAEGDFLLGDADRGSYLLWDHSAANLTLGKTGANSAALILSGSDILLYYNSVERMRLDTNGLFLRDAAGVSRVAIDSSAQVVLRDSTLARVVVTSAGVLTIRNSSGGAVFSFDSALGAEFTLPLTLGTNGGIYQGTGTFASPTTGLKIFNTSGIGRIAGYNTSVAQWYANTDGKLYAGGGAVVLDARGITIAGAASAVTDPLTYTPANSLVFESSSVVIGYLTGARYSSGVAHQITLAATPPDSNDDAEVFIFAKPNDLLYGAGAVMPSVRLSAGVTTVSEVAIDAQAIRIGHGGFGGSGDPSIFVYGSIASNLGIGTSIPYNLLHVRSSAVTGSDSNVDDYLVVENNGHCGINLIANPANVAQVVFSDDARARGLVQYNHSTDSFLIRTAGTNAMTIDSAQAVALTGTFSAVRATLQQASTTAAVPTLFLTQLDLSEEFIEFSGTVAAGNPIDTAALGTYYGKVRVSVNGTFKYLALYN